jgi:hypothetical protein
VEDLTPRIANQYDTAKYEFGQARPVTIVSFYLGRFGPFEETFDRNPDRLQIDQAIARRRDTLTGLTR